MKAIDVGDPFRPIVFALFLGLCIAWIALVRWAHKLPITFHLFLMTIGFMGIFWVAQVHWAYQLVILGIFLFALIMDFLIVES